MKRLLIAIFSMVSIASMAQTQIGVIRRFVDDGTGKMSSEPYYGGAVKYGSKPVFIVLKKKPALPVILPVILFTGERKDKYSLLKWEVTDAAKIELQRSNDGVFFVEIYSGNASQFLDKYPSYGRNYYRLKIYNKTGTFYYSNVVAIVITGAESRAVLINSLGQRLREGNGDNTDAWKSAITTHGWYVIRYQLRDGTIYVDRFLK
jgi:hypothetical protein